VKQGGANVLPDVTIEDGEYLKELSRGKKVNVEVECTTIRNPSRILENLAKAINNNKFCLFVVENDDIAKKVCDIVIDPFKINKDGNYEYYSSNSGSSFVPKRDFTRPVQAEDWKVMVFSKDSEPKEYSGGEKTKGDSQTEQDINAEDDAIENEIEAEQAIAAKTDVIENYLEENEGVHTPRSIAERLCMCAKMVATVLCRLVVKGTVLKEGRGRYVHRKWIVGGV